ncbi:MULTISPECIES: site-specific integrase [Roseomonadaceae]|uniref:Site-specific integrase n=1 Tax=Falsiroseomonas oleicola TaxID=2801474 RepID=A0ABS6HBR8_9PROT|nr:site-specific integrase [Roseomonas oleicola]MBU8546154.1 site-specific integrase [Roseomonas oleicola]
MLRNWGETGLPGLADDLMAFIDQPEHFEESGDWYFSLVANDPERGAFTEQELRSIRDGLNKSFEEGDVSIEDWTLVWFLIATGVRPVQIARMKRRDVIVTNGPEGKEVTLLIPLAKGQQQVNKARWRRKAPSVLAEVLLRYLQLPQFASGEPGAPLFCVQSNEVSDRLRRVFRTVKTVSERLGGAPIPIFPYRFRYTLGTRAIQLGASDHEAARLLTHRSTRCVHYYRASLPTLQQPIADAIGPEMGFIARAFQGRLIGTLEEATRKGQPGAVIRDFAYLVGQKLGACGTNAECHQNAPRACLTCRKFEPLRTAPWEQLLGVLKEDLDAEEEDRIRLITQEQIDVVLEIIAECDSTPETTPWAA